MVLDEKQLKDLEDIFETARKTGQPVKWPKRFIQKDLVRDSLDTMRAMEQERDSYKAKYLQDQEFKAWLTKENARYVKAFNMIRANLPSLGIRGGIIGTVIQKCLKGEDF